MCPTDYLYCQTHFSCSEPRGFGFVQYVDPADAAEAKYQMDGQILQGRELTVVFAEENRKKPSEMRARERGRYVLYIYKTVHFSFFVTFIFKLELWNCTYSNLIFYSALQIKTWLLE